MRDELLGRDARAGVGHFDDAPVRRRRGSTIVSQPPFGIASRALRNRLRNTCCSLYSIALHDQRRRRPAPCAPGCCRCANWCSSSDSTSLMTALRSTGPLSTCGRPRQVQQAVDDLRGAERLPLDLLEHLRPRIVGLGALEQHLREARDAGQRRVHLVRDAGGEQADRRHLLRDLQLLLELHARGDVLDDDDGAGDRRRPTSRSGVVADVDQQPARRRRAATAAAPGRAPRPSGRLAPRRRAAPRANAGSNSSSSRRADRVLVRGRRTAASSAAVPADHAIVAVDDEQAVVRATRGCSR